MFSLLSAYVYENEKSPNLFHFTHKKIVNGMMGNYAPAGGLKLNNNLN